MSTHFYHETLRRAVSAFGSFFTNIKVIKNNEITRVPLAYGPKQRFLARIQEEFNLRENAKIAIKLPRMSFEMTDLSYDQTNKTNRLNRTCSITENGILYSYGYSPYKLNMTLSVLSKNENDAQQIIEQILPFFQPDYTLTLFAGLQNNLPIDMTITLDGVTLNTQFEGDFFEAEKIVQYDLSFSMNIRFYGRPQDGTNKLIKRAIVVFNENKNMTDPQVEMTTEVDPFVAGPNDDYDIIESVDFFPDADEYIFEVDNVDNVILSVPVIGTTSGAEGILLSSDTDSVRVGDIIGNFEVGETITDGNLFAATITARTNVS